MSKKKRDKKYKGGVDAVKPTIVKVSAIKRPRHQQWWLDNRRIVKPALITAGIIALVIILLIGLVGIFV